MLYSSRNLIQASLRYRGVIEYNHSSFAKPSEHRSLVIWPLPSPFSSFSSCAGSTVSLAQIVFFVFHFFCGKNLAKLSGREKEQRGESRGGRDDLE